MQNIRKRGVIWMRLHEDGREFLIELMENSGCSHRQLAKIAGWSSHSYVGRLLDPNDASRTVSTDAGLRIAKHYNVRPDRFFVTEMSLPEGPKVRRKRTAKSRVVSSKPTTCTEAA